MNAYIISNAHVYMSKTAGTHEMVYSLAGRLQLSQAGWLVLSVPAQLIRGAFDALHEEGLELPQFFAIPVMSPSELYKIGGADKVTERGHNFNYTLGPVRSHEPNRNGISRAWYIQILSQELKRLRQSYGLDSYPPNSHSFQLPIGVRKTGTIQKGSVTKLAECMKEPDWKEYDINTVTAYAVPEVLRNILYG